mgnify:CR=1 FL=1
MKPGHKRDAGGAAIDWEAGWAKDYRLNDYSRLPTGQFADYGLNDYLAWLSDYLGGSTFKPHPEQDPLLERLTKQDPMVAMQLLGAHAGFDTIDCEDKPYYKYPADFEPGDDFSILVPRYPDEEPLGDDTYVDPAVQADFVVRDFAYQMRYQREMEEFLECWPGFAKTWNVDEAAKGAITEPPDAGWRVLLAAILRPVTDKNRRVALLKIFFAAYDDETSG